MSTPPSIAAALRVSVLVAVTAFLSTTARAQEPPPADTPADDPPRYQESLEVTGDRPSAPEAASSVTRFLLPVAEIPASVSVIPRTLFENQDARVAGDALRNASGVNVASGFGVFELFVLRGFDSLASGLMLVDGVSEPESMFYPLYNVSQVEVLKGPAGFLYGGNPLGGTVQLVRKEARPRPFGELSLSYGRFDHREAAADVNVARADGRLAARLNALHRAGDGYRDDKDHRLTAVNPTLTWRPDARTQVKADLEYVSSAFAPDSGLPVVDGQLAPVPRELSYQSPFDRSEQDVYRLRLVAERQLGARVTLRNTLYYTDLDWLSDGTLLAGVIPMPDAPLVARTFTELDNRQKLLGDRFEVQARFVTGGVDHELLAGIEASRLTDGHTLDVSLLPPLTVVDPVETATRETLVPLPEVGARAEARSRTFAPYVVDRVSLSPRWQIFAGARLDVLDFDEPLSGTERRATKLSPMGALVYRPSSTLSLYVQAGSAFAPPSSLVTGDREPEESRQLEIGIKRGFRSGKGLASLAAYGLEKDNIAIPDETGVSRQVGDQRSRGVEVELASELPGGAYATFAYAFTDAELTRFALADQVPFPPFLIVQDLSGRTAPFAPRHLASAWVERHLANGLGAGVGARYVGEQFIAEDNAFAIDDYLTLDAMASYRRASWKLVVNAKNLTDREYATRGFGRSSALPGSPLSVSGRLELAWGNR
jgi:iron complex outermembrane receptor protein